VSATPYMPSIGVGGADAYPIEVLGSEVELASPLTGMHQHRNVALAVAAAVELNQSHGFPVTPASIREGVRRTSWPGRLERITHNGVDWILDVAHNPAGAWSLRGGLRDASGSDAQRPWVLVFSCLRDKPLAELSQILFPLFKQVIFAPIQSPRATPIEDMMAAAVATGTEATAASSVQEALQLARREAAAHGALAIVSGSVYLVGEARHILMSDDEHKEQPGV
jgi:dihydrofolate synthase / folylpolyglutamate synthase